MFGPLLVLLTFSIVPPATVHAPAAFPPPDSAPAISRATATLVERDLSGPRVGFTVRPYESTSSVGTIVSQFGWHFEHHVNSVAGGPEFLTEFVPLVAGVEYGKFLPSASLGIGVRMPDGYEFGLGPTASIASGPYNTLVWRSALFLAVGRSWNVGGIHVPLNLILTTNKDSSRITLLGGYAIHRATRALPS